MIKKKFLISEFIYNGQITIYLTVIMYHNVCPKSHNINIRILSFTKNHAIFCKKFSCLINKWYQYYSLIIIIVTIGRRQIVGRKSKGKKKFTIII